MEIHVVFNIHVEVLEEPITPKLVLIVLPKIGIGVKVTLIDSVTHAFEVFSFGYNTKIYTYYGETISSYHLVAPTDNTCEQHVDDLAVIVKQMVIGD